MEDDPSVGYSPIVHVRTLLRKTSKLGVDPNVILRKCNLSFTIADVEAGKIVNLNRPPFLNDRTDLPADRDRRVQRRQPPDHGPLGFRPDVLWLPAMRDA